MNLNNASSPSESHSANSSTASLSAALNVSLPKAPIDLLGKKNEEKDKPAFKSWASMLTRSISGDLANQAPSNRPSGPSCQTDVQNDSSSKPAPSETRLDYSSQQKNRPDRLFGQGQSAWQSSSAAQSLFSSSVPSAIPQSAAASVLPSAGIAGGQSGFSGMYFVNTSGTGGPLSPMGMPSGPVFERQPPVQQNASPPSFFHSQRVVPDDYGRGSEQGTVNATSSMISGSGGNVSRGESHQRNAFESSNVTSVQSNAILKQQQQVPSALHGDSTSVTLPASSVSDSLVLCHGPPKQVPPMMPLHKLRTGWCLWYSTHPEKSKYNYEDYLTPLGTFDSIEGFWNLHQHCIRPSQLGWGSEYQLFRVGIKPMWEDPLNKSGARLFLRMRKAYTDHFWETVIIATLGEQLMLGDEINGIVVSSRPGQKDNISIWTRNSNVHLKRILTENLKRAIQLPHILECEFRPHVQAPLVSPSERMVKN